MEMFQRCDSFTNSNMSFLHCYSHFNICICSYFLHRHHSMSHRIQSRRFILLHDGDGNGISISISIDIGSVFTAVCDITSSVLPTLFMLLDFLSNMLHVRFETHCSATMKTKVYIHIYRIGNTLNCVG